MVLGFNWADRLEIAADLFKKLSLKFPTVLDSSDEATATGMQKYGAMGVPTSYLIDREGKVVGAWVGYEGESGEMPAALKKLGFE